MKKLILIALLLILFIATSAQNTNKKQVKKSKDKPLIKIAIVNSYNPRHICTLPQQDGFASYFAKYNDIFKFQIKGFYYKAKTVNITKQQVEIMSKKINKSVEKYNPDFIYTTDDIACKYTGIPLSTKYNVISSGLNKPPKKYIEEYKLNPKKNKIIFISEYIRLDNIFNLLEQNNIFIQNFYLIAEHPSTASITNYYMLQNYQKEINGKGKIYIYYVKTVMDLRKTLIYLQKQPYGVIIPVIQRVLDENGKYKDKLYVVSEISKINKKHLELGGNLLFCKFGLALCSMPDFYKMGEIAGSVVFKYLSNLIFKNTQPTPEWCSIVLAPNKIAINKERLIQLNYTNILNNLTSIYKIYDKIYEGY